MQNNYPVLKIHHTKELAQRTQTAFCYSCNCTLVPTIRITICNCLSRLTLTTDNICTEYYENVESSLLGSLYRLSKLAAIQMINRISKKTHTPESPWPTGSCIGRLTTTHASFEVTVPSTLIVTNWAAERSFTGCLLYTSPSPRD